MRLGLLVWRTHIALLFFFNESNKTIRHVFPKYIFSPNSTFQVQCRNLTFSNEKKTTRTPQFDAIASSSEWTKAWRASHKS